MSKDKVRVYQLARELNVESKDLIDLLKAAGSDVKNHMTALDEATRQLAVDICTGKVPKPVPARPAKPEVSVRPSAPPTPSPPALQQIPDPKKGRLAEIPKGKPTARIEAEIEEEAELDTKPAIATATISEPPIVEEEEPPAVEDEPAAPEPVPAAKSQEKSLPTEIAPAPVAAAVEEPPPPKAPPVKPLGPIPAPSTNRPMSMPSSGGGSSGGPRRSLTSREQRTARRPVIAAPPPSLAPRARTDQPPQKPAVVAQKPVMKLPPGAVKDKDGRMTLPGKANEPPPAIDPNLDLSALAEEDEKKGRGGAMAGRSERQKRRGQRAVARRSFGDDSGDDEETLAQRRQRQRQRQRQTQAASEKGPVILELPITVRSFSETAGVRANDLQRRLMGLGIMATINQALTEEQAQMLGLELNLDIQFKKEQDIEDYLALTQVDGATESEELLPRPPVVTFMGHVDHGKTSLMDRIRKANVVATESGGITQHIGAYQVRLPDDTKITFLDTPGHEAFTAMRARGANATDIVVLVVAADDGVMPQTEEAISHAKAAEVAIVVAMNKTDLPGANIEKLQQQLSTHGLLPEAWGGDTLMVPTSATTGKGIDELLEALAVVAELKELKANPNRAAQGLCIEASLSVGLGTQCTLLVRNGTLRKGDVIVCGTGYGKVRALFDDHGNPIEEAGPSTPVMITGLDEVPAAGEKFFVLEDLSRAREISEERKSRFRADTQTVRQHVTLESLFDTLKDRKLRELLVILKADVRGSLEAIKKEIEKLQHPEVRVRIIHEGIGGISESDVLLGDASDAIIIGFGVAPDGRAESLAIDNGVEIRRYDIIYQVSDDIKKALEGMLAPDTKEVQVGKAIIQETFTISRVGTVAGCRVIQGNMERNAKVRIIRDGSVIGTYALESLKRIKDDAKEVREGLECGIKLANFNDVKRGDILEAFKIEEIKRTL